MNVRIENEKTGEVKEIKVGWSWTLFLFSSFLGIPLFLRRLYVWGGIFLILWVVNIFIPYPSDIELLNDPDSEVIFRGLTLWFSIIFIGLSIYLGKNGNKMTGINYLENGWKFVDSEEVSVKFAKEQWKIK